MCMFVCACVDMYCKHVHEFVDVDHVDAHLCMCVHAYACECAHFCVFWDCEYMFAHMSICALYVYVCVRLCVFAHTSD